MTLLVRDEADIVAATIEHHIAAGVDFIIATDNGSVDGTTEILSAYQDTGILELHYDAKHDHAQGRRVTKMARRAASEYDADWIINCDADEFFWPYGATEPNSRGIADSLTPLDANLKRIWAWPKELLAHPKYTGSWAERLVILDNESLMPDGSPYGAKCCHRADPSIEVSEGNHIAFSRRIGPYDVDEVYASQEHPLELLHARNRGYAQFRRKIMNGGSALATNTQLPSTIGWQWRADYDDLRSGNFPAVYRSRQLAPERLQAGLTSGSLSHDTRLRDRLNRLLPHAILPALLHACLTSDWHDPPASNI